MPVCTQCAAYVDCVYTKYSENNIRLEQCRACNSFADRYVEEDALNLTLDLILMKGVILHLLYNRGTSPRLIKGGTTINPDIQAERALGERRRRLAILHVGITLVFLDSFIRWSQAYPIPKERGDIESIMNSEAASLFLSTLLSCFIEIILFHAGIIFACTVAFKIFADVHKEGRGSGIQKEFRLSHVSLALIYASLTKLFLLSLLVIWRPAEPLGNSTVARGDNLFGVLYHIFDDDKLNREWLLRNLLGGMASGFAIRVVLNGRPLVAAFIVLFAWTIKAGTAYVLSAHMMSTAVDRHWLIFSMP